MNKLCFILLFVISFGLNCQNRIIDEIKERGYISVGVLKNDHPPYYYIDSNGVLSGSDLALADFIGNKLGVEVRINRDSDTSSQLIDLVDEKSVDIVISSFRRTLIDAERVLFTKPYIKNNKVLLLNRIQLYEKKEEREGIRAYIRNFDETIAIVKGSSEREIVKELFPEAEVVIYNNRERVVKDLLKGKITAFYDDSVDIERILESNPEYFIHLQKVKLGDVCSYFVMVVQRDEAIFKQWLNILIKELELKQEDM